MTSVNKYLSVTDINQYIKSVLDDDLFLRNILVKGEISNFKPHSSGHFYFTLKDEKSQISVVMFRTMAQKVKFIPKNGMQVLISGHISLYEPSGNYQIYASELNEVGLGDLFLAFEELKEKLKNKGYFDEKIKKPIPKFPKKIGIITSPTGAAVKDMTNIIKRRYPIAEVVLFPALVQGVEAKDSLVENLKKADNSDVDVIIIGRGGGSIEDLWAFNEEIVADAIYNTNKPVISAVGHETDFTISDFVADLRAETPSGAAEKVVPDIKDLIFTLSQYDKRIYQLFGEKLRVCMLKLKQCDNTYIMTNIDKLFESKYFNLQTIENKLNSLSPKNQIVSQSRELLNLDEHLKKEYKRLVLEKENSLVKSIEKLTLLNPLNIMSKGYSIVYKDEKIISNASMVKEKDELTIKLSKGLISATVTKVEE